MADLSDDFRESFKAVWQSKKSVLPALLSTLLPLAVLALVVVFSGWGTLLTDLIELRDEWDGARVDFLLSGGSAEDPGSFGEFSESSGFSFEDYSYLLMPGSITIIILVLVVLWLISFYFAAMSWVASANLAAKRDFSDNLLGATAGKIVRLFLLDFLKWAIVCVPLVLAIALVVLMVLVSPVLAILLGLLLFLAYLAYAVWVGTRLVVATPPIFLDNKGAVAAIRRSFAVTAGIFQDAILLLILLIAASWLFNTVAGQPVYGVFWEAMLRGWVVAATVGIPMFIIFAVAKALLDTFLRVFICRSYIRFSKTKKRIF